jgi:hypothetical protein
MSYIGNNPVTQSFISGTDYFNGTGAQTAFTLSRTVASVNDIQAVVNNVVQVPNDAYTISGTTITFTSAPSAGTQNVYVRYLSTTTQAITPSQGTVSWNTLNSDVQQDLGISYKNRIINGNMAIDQRNAGAATANTINGYTIDRWVVAQSTAGKLIAQQNAGSVTPPVGFSNYLGITSQSAYSVSSIDTYYIRQGIEGFNFADCNWGTANAKTVTLSFWVRSSLTGTFGGTLNNAAYSRSYPFSYTISSANTWEQKSVTIPGDTTGTWVGATNGVGLNVLINLGAGSTYSGTVNTWASAVYVAPTGATSVVGTNGATFYITGVQLEVGTQATTFTTAGGSYGAELALCQRYFQGTTNPNDGNNYYYGSGSNLTTSIAYITYPFLVSMRASPTLTSSGTFNIRGGANNETVTAVSLVTASTTTAGVNFTVGGATLTQGYGVLARSGGATANTLFFSAEL